jgi:FAD synthase
MMHGARPMRIHGEGTLRLDASVVAIGAFDGVHRGHQSVILQAVEAGRALAVPAFVYTFDPPPKAVFGSARVLTPIRDKLDRLARLGPDHAVVAHFDRAYASRPPADFIEELRALNPAELWVGADSASGPAGRATSPCSADTSTCGSPARSAVRRAR